MQRPAILPGLTGLRGIGAVWVALYHLTEGLRVPVLQSGYLGVDLFFILSGFVLSHVYSGTLNSPGRFGAFLKARVARVYPLHLAMLLLLGLMVLAIPGFADRYTMPDRRFGVDAFVASALLVQNWAYFLPTCWNTPAWSLSAEWAAYLVFPALLWAAGRVPAGVAAPGLALLGYAVLWTVLRVKGAPLDVQGTPGMLRMIVEFGSGCLLFRTFHSPIDRRRAGVLQAAALAALAVAVAVAPLVFLALPAFAAIILLAARGQGMLAGLLAMPATVWAGEVSYALYMVHWPFLQLVNVTVPQALLAGTPMLLRVVLLFALILLLAAVTHRWIERPARAGLRHVPLMVRGVMLRGR